MRPLIPKMVLLLGAFLFFATASLCVVADAIDGKIEHYNDQDPRHVLIQLPPPVDQVVKNLETVPIVSVHSQKLHEIPETLAPRPSPVLAQGPHPSYTRNTIIRAKRPFETPVRFRDGLLWPRQLVWDPALIQRPSSRAVLLSETGLVKATPAAPSPSNDTVRVEKRAIKLPGSLGGIRLLTRPQAFSLDEGVRPSSSSQGSGGVMGQLKPYMNRVFPQLPYLPQTRTWTTKTASAAATSMHLHRHGFHNHQIPSRPSPSSSSSPSPPRPSSRRPVLNNKDPAAVDAAKKEEAQWTAVSVCLFLAVVVFLYLLTRGLKGERKGRQQRRQRRQERRSAANDSSNNDGAAAHALQSLRSARPVSNAANTSAAVPGNAGLPATCLHPLRQHPPTPPRASWQWGGLRSVGQVEEDRVYNPYTYPSAPGHSPPAYPSLSRAGLTPDTTSKIPTTSSGLPLTTLSRPASAARGSVSRSNSNTSSSTLIDNSGDARVRDMLASRNRANRESWESWNKKCLQNEKANDGVEGQKDLARNGASKSVPKWPSAFAMEQK